MLLAITFFIEFGLKLGQVNLLYTTCYMYSYCTYCTFEHSLGKVILMQRRATSIEIGKTQTRPLGHKTLSMFNSGAQVN